MKKTNRKLKKKMFLINRTRKIIKQRRKKKKRKNKKCFINISYNSKMLNYLDLKKFYLPIKIRNNCAEITLPKNFGFISNPNETIKVLKKVFYCLKNNNVKSIVFDYSKCEEIEMCASLILDLMVLEALKTRKIHLKGNYPSTLEAKLVLCISGLVKHLNLSNLELPSVKRLDIMSNLASDDMSEKVIDYYDECLKTQGYSLSAEGKSNFAKMVGEVIDNAEQYSGSIKSWHVVGHFNLSPDKESGKCRLVLMNFGNSIYESLKDETTTLYTKNLLQNHTKKTKKMFDFGFNEEVLWTLYALQQNVSKSRNAKEGEDRGNGTIKLIKAFSEIGETIDGDKPKMAIISGGSYILHDGTYKLKEENINGKKVSILAFNENNSLNELPDKNNVRILKSYFPGTIISLEFYLDRAYMDNVIRKEIE